MGFLGGEEYQTPPKNLHESIQRIIEFLGDKPDRDGLKNTPSRVLASWQELCSGYSQDPTQLFTSFEQPCDEMIVLRDIEFFSTCEHHMLPFYGTAHIAYVPKPDGKVVGISKLARLLEIYSRRLQIQERITSQVTTAIMEHLRPLGAGCVIQAKHLCMACRGVQKQHSSMVTSSMLGVFREKDEVRAEFLTLAGL